ncbi:hypothetical protein ACI2JR_09825 [Klebsiella sp. NPDC088457]
MRVTKPSYFFLIPGGVPRCDEWPGAGAFDAFCEKQITIAGIYLKTIGY